MATVMIGVDPHKASHTAVAIDEREAPLSERTRPAAARTDEAAKYLSLRDDHG